MERQFVVEVDNRPGALSHLAHVLALRGVDIHHVAAIGCGEAALVLLTVSDEEMTRTSLKQAGYTFTEGDSLLVQLDDRPGALAQATAAIADAGVNIRSTLVLGKHKGTVDMAFTVDNLEKARAAVDALKAKV